MISFKVSAPGKIILFGEHAVVYGKNALAGSLSLRTTLTFKEIEETNEVMKLNLLNIKLDVPISLIKSYIDIYNTQCLKNNTDNLMNVVKKLSITLGYSVPSSQKLCIEGFFYLLIYMTEKEDIVIKPVEINSSTELKIGAGLGSSASFSVCLSACFLHWSRLQKNIHKTLDKTDLEIISKYAFECEQIFHGKPSGIDNSICTYGSIIKFRRGTRLCTIPDATILNILLVDTNVERSTKAILDKTSKLKLMFPTIVESIMNAIDDVANEAYKILTKNICHKDKENKEIDKYNRLKTLVDMNQHFLAALQVSHPAIDIICTEAQENTLSAKLTGAGGGGHAFILLPPNTKPEFISKISQKLSMHKYNVIHTSLGGTGVTIDE